ncbi:MAG: sugar-binding protein [Succinivibrio sp.]|jgi:putative multiple sugar transport system substrate-binding protein|nr:sugar-binding protein [Succinivibrio sp.]
MKLKAVLALSVLPVLFTSQANAFTVGVLMPTQDEARWYREGFGIENELKNSGFNVELFFGGDIDVSLQQRQIKRLSNDSNIDALVIGSIDGNALADALTIAKSKKLPVISYDRLITGTDAVTYYATFDNGKVGEIQGKFLIDKLHPTVDDPKNIEIFYGSLDDNNAKFFYGEAMKILQPYIDSGALVIKSGEIKPEETNIPSWRTDLSSKRMDAIMDKVGYGPESGERLDGILSPADCISSGIIFTLKKRGYTVENIPVITGQDSTPDALKNIQEGYQAMTIFKDGKQLQDTVLDMVKAISKGQEANINDTTTYNNGVMDMKSFLCTPELIDRSNINKLL